MKISDLGAADMVAQLTSEQAAPIVSELPRQLQVSILRGMKKNRAGEILHAIKPYKVKKLERLMGYPENTAGGLMITEYLSFPEDMLVKEVLDDLREHGETYSDFDIQYAYVVSETGHLSGVLRLRDLLMAPRNRALSETMIKTPLQVNINASLRDLKDFFRHYTFWGVPVTDDEGKLVGVIRSSSVREAANRQNNQLFLKFTGIVGGEESRNMSLFKRSSRRLSWLTINIVLNTLVAVSFGGLVPLILRGMRTDPALASGPLLTTITDMCGFFFVLSFASLMLPRLTG